jgi:hypothetical protein
LLEFLGVKWKYGNDHPNPPSPSQAWVQLHPHLPSVHA